MQLQLCVCGLNCVDFVLWTKQTTIIERIDKDFTFISGKIENVKHFFINGYLPEIVGKWCSRGPVSDSTGAVPLPSAAVATQSTAEDSDDDDDAKRLWCYCSKPSFGDMMCDNKQCTIVWFHFNCLQICSLPKEKWYLPCRLLPKFNISKKEINYSIRNYRRTHIN